MRDRKTSDLETRICYEDEETRDLALFFLTHWY